MAKSLPRPPEFSAVPGQIQVPGDFFGGKSINNGDFIVIYGDFMVNQWDLMGSIGIYPLVNSHDHGKSPFFLEKSRFRLGHGQ